MTDLLKKKRFWLAVVGVAAVVINHFLGFDETQVIDVLGAIVAATCGTSAGLSVGKESGQPQ
jgi:hypothetical protein